MHTGPTVPTRAENNVMFRNEQVSPESVAEEESMVLAHGDQEL